LEGHPRWSCAPGAGILPIESVKKIAEAAWRNEVIALHDETPITWLTTSQIGHIFEQVKRHLVVLIHHRLFPNSESAYQ
jgi:hypothetical protein